jgi:GntP family gluconate:H+ symporter
MFFEVGLIVLLPLIFSVASRLDREGAVTGSPYLYLGVPTIAALSTLHGMVPPHPGPLIAVTGLHADLGTTILVGLVCAVPCIVLAGPVYGRWLAPRLPGVRPDATLLAQFTHVESAAPAQRRSGSAGEVSAGEVSGGAGGGSLAVLAPARVPTGLAVTAVLVPVLLMVLRTLAEVLLGAANPLRHALTFAGEPVVAMLAGFLFALVTLGLRGSGAGERSRASLTESLRSTANILLIIGGGGAFNQVLEESGIGKAVTTAAASAQLNVLLLGWLLALLLSTSTGSATVGIVAATGVVAPLVGAGGDLRTSLLVVAIGAGSIGLNYVNHAGFWLVKESFGMTLGQATKSHTVVQTLVSVIGLGAALLVSLAA